MTRRLRTYGQITEPAGAEIPEQIEAQFARLNTRLSRIRNVIVIASGKGGVGKSFITTHLATALAQHGGTIGVLDADLNGPSIAHMLRVSRAPLRIDADGVHPPLGRDGCRVMSADLLLHAADAPLRWSTPRGLEFLQQSVLEAGAVREFLSDVAWGDLDTMLIDLPPGTDKIARVAALLPSIALLLIVTTPSRVTSTVVARSLVQARELSIPRVALVMNMDGCVCPTCHTAVQLFGAPNGAPLDADVWARIPFEPAAAERTDHGAALEPQSVTAQVFASLAQRVNAVLS